MFFYGHKVIFFVSLKFNPQRAGGDVKKNGVDPYAYLPLSQAAKKQGGKQQRVHLVGRR